jgi:hypothetical protein
VRKAAAIALGAGSLLTASGMAAASGEVGGKAMVATLEKPAVTQVLVPHGRRPAFVDVHVSAYVPSRGGPVDALVTLSGRSGPEREVGRFSVFPAERFTARDPSEERTFRLDASKALKSASSEESVRVTVRLVAVDPARPPVDARLTIKNIEVSSRP